MLAFFKHFALRIWVTVILGGLASLWALSIFQSRIGLQWTLFPVALIILGAFVATGWVTNRWGLNTVEHLIREASIFERDGMVSEAENAFQRAVAVFDSFLISPFVKKKTAGALAARVARFYLARARKSFDSEAFLVSYLKAHPEDEEVAENWLQQIESRGGLKEEHQELAYLIGGAQPTNRNIQSALARYYLVLERTDFPALQTYRRVLKADEHVPIEFVDSLAQIFLRERRADEWALEIYLKAIEGEGDRSELLKGIAACARWISATQRNKPLLQNAYNLLEGIDPADIRRMSAGFKPPVPPSRRPVVRREVPRRSSVLQTAGEVLRTFYEDITAVPLWIIRQILSLSQLIMHSKKARRVFSGMLLAGLSAGVIVLVINTVGHLTKTEKLVGETTKPVPTVIMDPFTLQVAAYLKPEYAKKYVAQLKKKGLNAYWTEKISGNKKWYQVRVSHFADKKSARTYGESLKTRGLIEDYYIANTKR